MGSRRWRDYATAGGRRPVKEFVDELDEEEVAAVVAALKEVEEQGLRDARHLRGPIYEVRAKGNRAFYRILFALQGRRGQVLLALVAFKKKTQKTPHQLIRLAERRLRDWEERGSERRKRKPSGRNSDLECDISYER
jgi:phage-related protein